MQINKINSISFRENTLSREMDSSVAILMLRDSNASVKFQRTQDYVEQADSVDANPIKAIGYKLYRTFNLIKSRNNENSENNGTGIQNRLFSPLDLQI